MLEFGFQNFIKNTKRLLYIRKDRQRQAIKHNKIYKKAKKATMKKIALILVSIFPLLALAGNDYNVIESYEIVIVTSDQEEVYTYAKGGDKLNGIFEIKYPDDSWLDVEFKKGKMEGEAFGYYSTGAKKSKAFYYKGELIELTEYYLDGTLKSNFHRKENSDIDATMNYYNDNGDKYELTIRRPVFFKRIVKKK